MSGHDPFPSIYPRPSRELGTFYCSHEDERREEPEIIVDPLSGFVVALLPCRRQERRSPLAPSLWRAKLKRWLRLKVATATPLLGAGILGHDGDGLGRK